MAWCAVCWSVGSLEDMVADHNREKTVRNV